MKNILSLSTSNGGGAGAVARNTHRILMERGYTSMLVVKIAADIDANTYAFKHPPLPGTWSYRRQKWAEFFQRQYRRIFPFKVNENYSFYGLNERKKHYSAKQILKHVPFTPEVIFVFWVSEFINTKTVKELVEITGAKPVFMMTDNAPLTGGCHYPWQCKGFETDCSSCPGILTRSKKNIPQKNLAFKKANLPENAELTVSSTSDFERASRSLLYKQKKLKWAFAPQDHQKFSPGDKNEARAYFGVSGNKRIIFYGASEFKYLRKGGTFFLEALIILKEKISKGEIRVPDFQLLVAGKDWQQYFKNVVFDFIDVGFLNEDGLITAFRAADFFVSPSVEDSGPAMVIQSVLCGTPLVAFETGAAMDIVQTGKTGYLAKLSDSKDLAEGIRRMLSLSDGELKAYSENCRQMAVEKYTIEQYLHSLTTAFSDEG